MRIDEYGHIIDDDDEEFTPPETVSRDSFASAGMSDVPLSTLLQSTPWYGHGGLYWTVTLALAAFIAYASYEYLGPSVAGMLDGSGGDLMSTAADITAAIGPAMLVIGAFVGCIWYNLQGTKKEEDYYTGANYIVSPLCAAGGVLGMMVATPILAIVIAIFLWVLVICFIIAVLFSGG